MESGCRYAQMILLTLVFVLCSCRPASEPNNLAMDASLLQPGDLIYRLGNGLYSVYFKDFSRTEKLYSHVGVVAKMASGDSLWVVHSEASELTGQGNVRMETLPIFLKDSNSWAVYRLKKEEKVRSKIAHRALEYYHRAVPFDLEFDVADSTAFYCTELVMHCVNAAIGEYLIQPNTLVQGKRFVAIDDTYLHDWIEPVLKDTDLK